MRIMVRISLVSLLAAASTALASANRVPGGFIVELADGHVRHSHTTTPLTL